MHICIFEDHSSQDFYPLTTLRPVYDLRCGILTLREKILHHLSADSLSLVTRPFLADFLQEQNPGVFVNRLPDDSGTSLFVNGRSVMTRELARVIRKEQEDVLYVAADEIVAARLSGENLKKFGPVFLDRSSRKELLNSVRRVGTDSLVLSYPWDLLYGNETELLNDFLLLTGRGKRIRKSGKVHRTAVLVRSKEIHVGKKAEIGPGVVLDASEGPIYIGPRARILPHVVIEGPACIGEASLVKAGSRICGHTTIGPVCKVAGEVEHSILLAFANKQHDGYLGHSYLASWVNLGAGTTTSNLKNTYGNVKAYVNGELIDTKRMFLGLTAGDHVKTGINATIDTGTVMGVSSNVFGTNLPPKYVPPFSWGQAENLTTYEFEKAYAVAEKVMARRSVVATNAYAGLFRHAFDHSEHERSQYKKK